MRRREVRNTALGLNNSPLRNATTTDAQNEDSNGQFNWNNEGISSSSNDRSNTIRSNVDDRSNIIGSSNDRSNIIGNSNDRSNIIGSSNDRSNIIGSSNDRSNIIGNSNDRSNIIGSSNDRSNIIGSSNDRSNIIRSNVGGNSNSRQYVPNLPTVHDISLRRSTRDLRKQDGEKAFRRSVISNLIYDTNQDKNLHGLKPLIGRIKESNFDKDDDRKNSNDPDPTFENRG